MCLFSLSACFLQPIMRWKWTNFMGLAGSLLLLASNWVIPLSLMNMVHQSENLSLPENFLIFRLFEWSLHGNQADFISFMRTGMLLGFTVCVGASVYSVAYWKERFVGMIQMSIKKRNSSTENQ